jgi:hypothetical protein
MIPSRSIAVALAVIGGLLVSCHATRTPRTKSATDQPGAKQRAQSVGGTKLRAGGADADWPSVAEVRYRAFQQTRDADEEARAIGYDKSQGTVLKVHRAWVAPVTADPGQAISSEIEYAVLGPENELEVAEEWEILRDGSPITSTSPRIESRSPGGWRVSVSIGLPHEAKPGVYVMRSRVSAGQIADSRDLSFKVARAETARPPRTKSRGVVAVRRDPPQQQARLEEPTHGPVLSDAKALPRTQPAPNASRKYSAPAAPGEGDAQTLAALKLPKPMAARPCEKAQGTIKQHLPNPAETSGQGRAIEVCDTGADYRLDGVLVITKNMNHPAFAQTALDDLSQIASVSDPSGHVGFDFLVQLIDRLNESRLPAAERAVYIRWGGEPSRSKPDQLVPFTRPGTSGDPPSNAQWQAATAQGLDAYSDDGTPVGGAGQFFRGLPKGTGSGIGASVFYQPEALADPTTCPSGLTSDIALLHELQHATQMVLGKVDNTPYPNSWWNRDPLAARYGVHEERFVVERENEYRSALKHKDPSRYADLQPRQSSLGDC